MDDRVPARRVDARGKRAAVQRGRLDRSERGPRGHETADDLAILDPDEGEAEGIVERRPDDALELGFIGHTQ